MANRDFKFLRALERVVTVLDLDISIGATGAPTLTTPAAGFNSYNLGLTSITRASAGVYNLVLADNYSRLLYFDVIQIGALQDLTFQISTDFAAAVTGATLSFTCKTAASATDPTNGTSLRILLVLKNSSVS